MSETATDPAAQPYAVCLTCGIDLLTPEAADEHGTATMTPPAYAGGLPGQSHSWRVVNPSPKERAQSVVDRAATDAMDRFCEAMDDEVRRGRITKREVTEALRSYPDFEDGWLNWLSEDAS